MARETGGSSTLFCITIIISLAAILITSLNLMGVISHRKRNPIENIEPQYVPSEPKEAEFVFGDARTNTEEVIKEQPKRKDALPCGIEKINHGSSFEEIRRNSELYKTLEGI